MKKIVLMVAVAACVAFASQSVQASAVQTVVVFITIEQPKLIRNIRV